MDRELCQCCGADLNCLHCNGTGTVEKGVERVRGSPWMVNVLEGEYEWAIDDNPARILKVGDTFYEPTRCLHRVSKNPSKRGKTRILAVVLHPVDVKDIVIPEREKKQE